MVKSLLLRTHLRRMMDDDDEMRAGKIGMEKSECVHHHHQMTVAACVRTPRLRERRMRHSECKSERGAR